MDLQPTSLPPNKAEISARVINVQAAMSEQGLDYYLCHDPANIFYLTNFANFVHERPFILVIPAAGTMTFLMPQLEETHVRIRSVGPLVFVHYFEFPAPVGQRWSDRLREIVAGS
ncbi:MAG: Xaa-Pro dipeptidase, partial [Halioglobus sp.]